MKLPKIFVSEKDLKKLVLEPCTRKEKDYRDFNPNDHEILGGNHSLHFNNSLDFLKTHSYERHFRPWEYFGSIINHLECNLKEGYGKLVKKLLECEWGGVWLSMAFERKGDRLICYMDPENIKKNVNENYLLKGNIKYNSKEEFEINQSFTSDGWTYLENFNDDFVEYFYTRKFKDLPEFIRKGRREAKVYLPPEGTIWPVCTDDPPYLDNNTFTINAHSFGPRCCLGLRKKR